MLAAAVAPSHRLQRVAFGVLLLLVAALGVLVLRAAGEVLYLRVRCCVCGPLAPAGSPRQPLLRAGDRLLAISCSAGGGWASSGTSPTGPTTRAARC